MIENPEYKGKVVRPMINNPGYKGKWKPARIPTLTTLRSSEPQDDGHRRDRAGSCGPCPTASTFDNFLVTDNVNLADAFARETFDLKQAVDARPTVTVPADLDYSNKNPWLYAVCGAGGLPSVTSSSPLLLRLRGEARNWRQGFPY